jgi:hypothetical protein
MDRLLWVTLLRLWPDWRKALILFKPDTVIGWHRRGFRLYWKCKSRRGRIGRPGTAREIREPIRIQAVNMEIGEVLTAPRSPRQTPYVEGLIGSLRRECLDHVLVMNESWLRRHVACYLDYYRGSRSHLALGEDSPDGRAVEPPELGWIVAVPKVGGLHHRYERRAA